MLVAPSLGYLVLSPMLIVFAGAVLGVLVEAFMTDDTTASTYYRLLTDEGKILSDGRYQMTEEQFAEWGRDNSVVNEYVAEYLGVTIIS